MTTYSLNIKLRNTLYSIRLHKSVLFLTIILFLLLAFPYPTPQPASAEGEALTISAPTTLSGTYGITATRFSDKSNPDFYFEPAGTSVLNNISGSLTGNATTATNLTDLTTTVTKLNYLTSVTGTTGTASTNLVFSASPTFTGTVTHPSPFTLGATSVTTTGTQLNYLSATTGTTGTGNVVLSASPTFTGTITGGTYNGQTISSATSFTGSVAVAGALDANGAMTLGDGADALTIASTTLDLTAGAMSGITTLAMGGALSGVTTLAASGAITGGTYNGQTISSAASFTGSVAVATNIELSTTGSRSLSYYGAESNGYITKMQTTATAGYDTYGPVSGDWALYNKFAGATTRGWIWQFAGTNIAALGGTGDLEVAGTVTANGGFKVDGYTSVDASGNMHYSYNPAAPGGYDKFGKINASGFGIDANNDGTYDLLVYDGADIYTNRALLGYGGAATITTYNTNEDLYIAPNGTGQVGIGIADPTVRLHVSGNDANYIAAFNNIGNATNRWGIGIRAGQNTGGTGTLVDFYDGDGTKVGAITFSSTTTAYNTTSDARLKNILGDADMDLALERLSKVRVRNYEWKETPGVSYIGFIAQELYQANPDAVTVGEDDPTKRPWQVDRSALVPDLIMGFQSHESKLTSLSQTIEEQQTQIEDLKSQLESQQQQIDELKQAIQELKK